MKRRAIRRNHDTRSPHRCLFFDCETYQQEVLQAHCHHQHVYRLSCTQYWVRNKLTWSNRECLTWKNPHEMWSYIFQLAKGEDELHIFAHNAMFDLTVSHFWDYIDGGEVILHGDRDFHTGKSSEVDDSRSKWQGIFVADDRRVIIECCGTHGRLKILDSMNYYRSSLADIGESIGVPKHPMPLFTDPDSDWMYYCINDVTVLARAMTGLMREWKDSDYGNWQPTASSLAWSCYRHRFMPRTIYQHDEALAISLENAANYGGECRAFFVGDVISEYDKAVRDWRDVSVTGRPSIDGPCHLYDIRSLYPAVMKNWRMPCRLLHTQDESTPDILARLSEKYWLIANVHIRTDDARYPKRLKHPGGDHLQDRLAFPVGDYHTTLCGAELSDALLLGHVVSSSEAAVYERDMLFESWVDHWHQLRTTARDDCNKVREEMCKLMMNSLYGRFAMSTLRWKINTSVYPLVQWGTFVYDDAVNDRLIPCRAVGGNVLTQEDAGEDAFQLKAVACAITSAGRYHMRQIRDSLPARSVLYQDTDSLLLTDIGRQSLLAGEYSPTHSLGSLRHVATYQSAVLFGQRNLSLDGADRIAGLPKLRACLGSRRYEAEVWEQAESLLSRACPDTIRVDIRSYDFSRPSLSDVMRPDGWTTPLRLCNDRTIVAGVAGVG